MKTITQTMDKQQGLNVSHRELYSVSCDKPYGKEYEKNTCVHIYITESLCCTSVMNTTL